MILLNILLAGLGLIIALGAFILLDRRRFDRKPRMQYRLAAVVGCALSLSVMVGII